MRIYLSLVLIIAPVLLKAQDLVMTQVGYKDNKVIIHYDLNDSVPGRTYIVRAFASSDNYLNPLEHTIGDLGFEIRPGTHKRIVWDPIAELGADFDGTVSIEVRARVFIPFITMESFEEYRVLKRKRAYNLTWRGGTEQNVLNVDVFRGDEKMYTFPNVANVGHYKMVLPGFIKPGNKYRLRISDTKNKDEVVYSEFFSVKRKVPLALKGIAVLVVSGLVYQMLSSSSDDSRLPDPVVPK